MSNTVRLLFVGAVAACILAFVSAAGAYAAIVKRGTWHVEQTVSFPNGSKLTSSYTRCSDPDIELGMWLKPGQTALGCSWDAPERRGNQYIIHEKCTQMNGFNNIVLTVQSDSAYTKTTDEGMGKMRDKSVVVARRVGDCSR